MGRTKRLPPGDPGASTSNAAGDVDACRSLDDLPEEALSNIASRLMVFRPPFERECHGVRTSIELASTCARLRRIVIGAWCQNLLKAPEGGGGKGKQPKVKVVVSEEEVDAANLAQLKEWCAQMGLKKGGKKAELQLRVLAAQKPESSSGIPPELKRFISSQNRARVTVTNAKKEYRVGEQELGLLPSEQRPNPIDPSYAPMRLYAVNDVLAAAKARFKGDAEWFRDSSRRAPKFTPDCQQALQLELGRTGQPKRRAQVERAMKAHGLDPDEHRAAFQEYIETGAGSLDMIVRIINTGDQGAREAALREALKAAGLPEDHATSCQLFRAYLVNAQGKGPAELVPMLQRQLAYEASRLEAATSALTAAGLDPATHLTTPPFMAHTKGGTGALATLVEAAQAAAARSAAATAALASAGLNPADHMATEPFVAYVRSGTGNLGQLVANAVLVAARGRIGEKLVAAGLPAALAGASELQPFVEAEASTLRAAASGCAESGAGGSSAAAAAAAAPAPPAAAAAAPAPAAAAAAPPAVAAAAAAAAVTADGVTPEALAAAAAAPMQRRAAAIAALRAAGLLTAAAGADQHDAGLEGDVLLEAPELNEYLMVPYEEDAVVVVSAGVAGVAAAEAERAEAAEARLRAAVLALADRLRVEAVHAQSAAVMEAAQQRQKQQLQLQKQAQERQAQQARTQQALQQRQAAVAAALARPAVASQGVRSVKQEALVPKAENSVKQEPGVKKEAGVKLESVKEEAGMKLEAPSDAAAAGMGQRQGRVGKKRKVKQQEEEEEEEEEEEAARPATGRRSKQAKRGGRRGRRRAASESGAGESEAEASEEEEEREGEDQQEAAVAYRGARRSTRAVRARKRAASLDQQQDEQLEGGAAEEAQPAIVAGARAKQGRKRTASSAQQEEEEQQQEEEEEEEEKARPAPRPKKRTAGGLCVCCGDGRATRQCEHACCEDCCPGPCKKHGC